MRNGLRVDRIVALSLAVTVGAVRLGRCRPALPILMYHSVSDQLDGSMHPYFRTVTSPRVFAAHIDHLRSAGYRAITLTEALSLLRAPYGAGESLRQKV